MGGGGDAREWASEEWEGEGMRGSGRVKNERGRGCEGVGE